MVKEYLLPYFFLAFSFSPVGFKIRTESSFFLPSFRFLRRPIEAYK